MGFFNLVTGDYEGVSIPKSHPLFYEYAKQSLFGELFMVVLFIWSFCKYGDVIALGEDNQGCIAAIRKYKTHRAYACLALYFAKLCRELNITIIVNYIDTDTILADPISRIGTKDWE